MIIGNGLIANAFKSRRLNHDDYIIFASGVSDSNETNANEFIREHSLLRNTIEQNPNKKLIYFTSILSNSLSNRYYLHKNNMEKTIELHASDYIIYRIPQLVGSLGNKNNLINLLKDNIMNDKEIVIYRGVKRAILDVEDLVDFVIYSMDKVNREYVNVSYIEKLTIFDLVHLISNIVIKNPSFKVIDDRGENWFIENSTITLEWILFNNIQMRGYTDKVLRKYI